MTHGKKIKMARVQADMLQSELADKAGMQQAAISQLERNLRDITVTQLMDIAKILGVEAKNLLPDPE